METMKKLIATTDPANVHGPHGEFLRLEVGVVTPVPEWAVNAALAAPGVREATAEDEEEGER